MSATYFDSVTDADDALRQAVKAIFEQGIGVRDSGHALAYTEVLNYQFKVDHPLARITMTPTRPLNSITAIARFIW
ncbi:MAG TPA: hypothetical protein VHW06_13595, partial [Streptosporangiaceae bacterium]|nr:hypothetical protein [Streptosporangiaceae bacterium]